MLIVWLPTGSRCGRCQSHVCEHAANATRTSISDTTYGQGQSTFCTLLRSSDGGLQPQLHEGYSKELSADLCCRRYDGGVCGCYRNSLIHDLTEKCHSRTTAKGREMPPSKEARVQQTSQLYNSRVVIPGYLFYPSPLHVLVLGF